MSDRAARDPSAPGLRHARPGDLLPALMLLALAGVCWAITVRRMRGMDMGPGTDLGGIGWFALVWATMMAAMMLPSMLPAALGEALARRARGDRSALAGAALFTAGYLLTWLGAGLLAWSLLDGARLLELRWLAWPEAGRFLAAGVILGAAFYELTPVKSACLRFCRDPRLLARRRRAHLHGALLGGLEHGCYCVGSTWALMAALFALGVMNVAWMAVVAALVAVEKLWPRDRAAVLATAVLIGALGLAVAVAPGHVPGLTIPR